MAAENKRDVCIVLLAGGVGKRFGVAVPKLLTLINGKPMLAHSIGTAMSVPFVNEVIIACNPAIRSELERIVEALRRDMPGANEVYVFDGGNTRSESVEVAMTHCTHGTVLIHDADRPVTTPALYERVFKAVRPGVGAIPVISPADSVVHEDSEGKITGYLPRAEVMLVQTPQGFKTAEYRMAREILRGRLEQFTDDGSVFLAGGYRLTIVPGERSNIKVTFPVDMYIADAYMNELSEE